MNLTKLLIAMANVGGWGSFSSTNITSDDVSSTFGDANDDNFVANIERLDTNKVVIAYAYFSTGGSGSNRVVVAQIDPVTGVVTFGTPVDFGAVYVDAAASTPDYIFGSNIAILSTTSFVLGWTNGSGHGKCAAATVSGTTITLGTVVNIQTTSTVTLRYIQVCALDSTNVIFVYRHWGTTNIRASLHTVSGTTMTYRSVVTLTTNVAYAIQVSKLDNTRLIVALGNGANAGYNGVVVVTYSGTTISIGTLVQLSSASTASDASTVILDTSNFIAFFKTAGDLGFRRYSVSGTTITAVSPATVSFNSLLPTATYRLSVSVMGFRFVLLAQEGSSYYVGTIIHLGDSETTSRPMFIVFRITPSTEVITLAGMSYLSPSTTLYSRWITTLGSVRFTKLNDSFVTCYGFFKDGTTYTMKLFKIMV